MVFFNSFETTSSASELSTIITFVSKNPGTKNVEIEVTYPESINCTWYSQGGVRNDIRKIEYNSCSAWITYKVINKQSWDSYPDPYHFVQRQVYYVNGRTIALPWQLFPGGLDFSERRVLTWNKDTKGDTGFRFYGPGEMQIEFDGLYSESYSANSLPKIRLLGLTKAEAIAVEIAEEKRALEEERRWEFDIYNDGIDNFIYVDQGDSSGYGETLRIYCQNKRIGAWISADYAESRGWKGKAQIRFDSKPVKQLSYTVNRQFDLISIDNPKAFISEFLKSKEVLVKIGTVNGSQLSTFHIGDLKNYKKRFTAKGCNLG